MTQYQGTAFLNPARQRGGLAMIGYDRLLTAWQAVVLCAVWGGLMWRALAWLILSV